MALARGALRVKIQEFGGGAARNCCIARRLALSMLRAPSLATGAVSEAPPL